MQLRKRFIISAFLLMLIPASASAQSWFFSSYVGANFGGNGCGRPKLHALEMVGLFKRAGSPSWTIASLRR